MNYKKKINHIKVQPCFELIPRNVDVASSNTILKFYFIINMKLLYCFDDYIPT